MMRYLKKYTLLLLLTWASAVTVFGQLYENFFDEVVEADFTRPIGIVFDETGRGYVWEQAGKVFIMTPEGEKLPTPLLDISEEVIHYGDHGLLGFCLHPNFYENGYYYVAYIVDRHHLLFHGTPDYNPDISLPNEASIGRVTRFQADASNDFRTTIPGSRKVLLGETIDTGLPILMISHGIGTLAFGSDGSLLLSVGDSGSFQSADMGSADGTYFEQALDDGILKEKENIGSFRSQMVDCMLGKILRLDPETGNGLPSNPFYDPQYPRAPRSRVWALGFRNPYRFIIKPNTGAHSIDLGDPGHLFVGDVGANLWEETTAITEGGMNTGWPLFEGYVKKWPFYWEAIGNTDAPNPLNELGECSNAYFTYRDLIQDPNVQEDYIFANPCLPSQPIPATVPTFVHQRPTIAWSNVLWNPPERTYTPSFDELGNASAIELDSSASVVEGTNFAGYSSLPGFFYEDDLFPEQFHGNLFQADYRGWIRAFELDENYEVLRVTPIHTDCKGITHLTYNPADQSMYYTNVEDQKVHRIAYSGTPPPVIQATASQYFGSTPLQVSFIGSESYSPFGSPLAFYWDFGDGTSSTEANPTHVFESPSAAPTPFVTELTVTDTAGTSRSKNLLITLNNTPPVVDITSFEDGDFYPVNGVTNLPLRADVRDAEHSEEDLTYAWTTYLHHNTHFHPEPSEYTAEAHTLIEPLGCQDELFWYRIELTVTDGAGLSTTASQQIYPYCGEAIVSFLNLQGYSENRQAHLRWQTADDTNITHFEIQKKQADNLFATIGEVTSSGTNQYQFTDVSAIIGLQTYRIMAVNTAGIYSYSNEVDIEVTIDDAFRLYPNPTRSEIYLELKEATSEQIEWRLYDSLGKLVDTFQWSAEVGRRFEGQYLTNTLSEGVYLYTFENGSYTYKGKLVVVK